MGFDRELPPPVFGISTVPQVTRPLGYAGQQKNWRNDVQDKLTRRPKTLLQDVVQPAYTLANVSSEETYVTFRDSIRREINVATDHTAGQIEIQARRDYGTFTSVVHDIDVEWFHVDAVAVPAEIGINDIEDEFYVWNKNTIVETVVDTTAIPELTTSVCLINVTQALNYAETVEIKLYQGDTLKHTVSHTVPGLTGNNQDVADEQRATNYVANALSVALTATILATGTSSVKGSNVHVIMNDNAENWRMEVSSGRGDGSLAVLNHKTPTIEGLPKYCLPDVVRSVVPDPTSDDGRYYLQASPVEESVTGMQEVIWTETHEPAVAIGWPAFPYVLAISAEISGVTVDEKFFKSREVGDDESNPTPYFVGKAIKYLETFQDRLLFLAGDKVNTSKTDDNMQFWKNSAIELLVTDPTSIGTSGNSSQLKYTVFHNRDLLIFAGDAQFKLDSKTAITPQTAALSVTTKNECNLDVEPILMGSAVYYANNYGGSAGVRRFEVEADTVVDTSLSITDHIIGLMPGELTVINSNANQTMLVCRSSLCLPNQLFVFEQQTIGDSIIYSWCEWQISGDFTIDNVTLFDETITLRGTFGTDTERHYITCPLKSGEEYPDRDICLDALANSTITDGKVIPPVGYPYNELEDDAFEILLLGTSRDVLTRLEYEFVAGEFVLLDEFEEGTPVVMGYTFESLYEPSTLYERTKSGAARTTDRLRIAHYFLELSNTYRLTQHIISKYWDIDDETFTSLDSATNEFFGEVLPVDAQWRPSVGMVSTDYTVQFVTSSPYAATIASISYRGQQFSTKLRR